MKGGTAPCEQLCNEHVRKDYAYIYYCRSFSLLRARLQNNAPSTTLKAFFKRL